MLTISFKSVPSGLKKRILNSTSSKRTKNFANTSCKTCNKSIIHADVSKSPWNVSTIGRVLFLTWLIIITSVNHHKFSTQVQGLKQKRYILIWSLLDNNVWAWSRSCSKDLPSFVHYHQNTILIKRLTSWSSAKTRFSFLHAPHREEYMTSIKGLRRNWTIKTLNI